jgi:hypothetical protein
MMERNLMRSWRNSMSSLNLLKKKGDIVTRVRGHLSVHWKDKRDVYVLTKMHTPPLDGNF